MNGEVYEIVKKIYNKIFNVDYIMNDAKKAIKLRISINHSKKNFFFKVIRKFKERKYNKICYKNNAFIPIGVNFKVEGNVCFPHGLCGIFISGGATIGNNCTIFQQVTFKG